MQTNLSDRARQLRGAEAAEAVLRTCVHCGFCNATCPTYQLLGNELDGPRGRIYLIKQMLETGEATEKTRLHLDRCLTCRSCESTCPSGVHYSRLLDIGREVVASRVPRSGVDGLTRAVLKHFLPRPGLFNPAMRIGQMMRPLLPAALKAKVPERRDPGIVPAPLRQRKMIVLAGCVQPAMLPGINAAAMRVLDRLGITLVEAERAGCCGALRLHLDDAEGARDDARRNIDAWLPLLDAGHEAIVMTASGCGVQVRDYAHLLQDDTRYATKAARIALATRDISEIVIAEKAALLELLQKSAPAARRAMPRAAFHASCTLQHGQKIRGVVEELLVAAGYALAPVTDAHLCCGSAGTYSVLQPQISTQLRDNKLGGLGVGGAHPPEVIASANIGCITHLQSGTSLPVRHWIELLDERLGQ
jgi:glycolate oxidase iron-sulfur subunit